MVYLRNFGHDGFERFNGIGINGKNSEFHAVMGLVVLKYMPEILNRRRNQVEQYKNFLSGLKVSYPTTDKIESYNYCYFPIIFSSEELLLKSKKALEDQEIGVRRYFYPGLNSLDYTGGNCHISDEISCKVLCLPLYHSLSPEEQKIIARILLRVQNNPNL